MHLTPVVLGLAFLLPAPPPAADDALSALLPEGRLAEVHVPSGKAVWDSELGRRIHTLLEDQGAFDELQDGLAALRMVTGSDPTRLIELVLGGELELGVYPTVRKNSDKPDMRNRKVLAVARTGDADGLALAMNALDAVLAANPDAKVKNGRHRKQPYMRFDDASLARVDDMLLFATDQHLLTGALDRWLDGASDVVATPFEGLASFELDTRLFRAKDIALLRTPTRKLLGKRLANPLANLLFGGLTVGEGTLHGTLTGSGEEIELDVCLPPVPDDAPRAWFPPEPATTTAMPVTPDTLAVLSLRRDLADWWRNRETYMPDGAQPALAKADQNMALIFAGQSPAEDVFGQASTEMALIVDRQRFEGGPAVPDVRLPAFCLVTPLRDPAQFTPTLSVAFQTLMGVINTDRAQNSKAPFLLDTVPHEGIGVRAAQLLPGAGSGGLGEPAAIDFNFSPAVAVVDGWALVGTSAEQVRRLVSALHAGEMTEARGVLSAHIDAERVLDALEDNRGALIAQEMLDDGLGPEEAAAEVDGLLGLVAGVHSVAGSLTRQDDCLHADFDLVLNDISP
jgi:hypothetical protein